MTYTVKELAKLSGVSIRTLHFYDEIGLLTPAYLGENGYRHYGEKELLLLQQILFFRELDFELKKIKKILKGTDFDQIAALHAHRKVLVAKGARMDQLIQTIDKTIQHINGEKTMKNQELYSGFSPEKQAEYEEYLVNRLGDKTKARIDECKKNMKPWTKADWEKFSKGWVEILEELAALLEKSKAPDSPEVQHSVQRHFKWLPWSANADKESYIGLGQGYTEFEWKKAFVAHDPHHPRLAKFLAEGMRVFAENNLS